MSTQHAVGTFSSYKITEAALQELRLRNFSMDKASVVGLDVHQQTEIAGASTSDSLENFENLNSHNNRAGEKAIDGAIAGVTVGGLAGLLTGMGGLIIPGVGPLLLVGTSAMAIVGLVSGGVLGTIAGGLAGALVGVGIPEDRAELYSNQIAKGNYLIMVEGTKSDIDFAKNIFNKHHINDWYVYNSPKHSTRTVSTTTTTRTVPNH